MARRVIFSSHTITKRKMRTSPGLLTHLTMRCMRYIVRFPALFPRLLALRGLLR